MDPVWRYVLLIAFTIISVLVWVAFLWLIGRRLRPFVRSTVCFVYLVIFVCAFVWLWTRLHGKPFVKYWPVLVLLLGVITMSFVTALLWPKPSLKAKVLIRRSAGALSVVSGTAVLMLDGWETRLLAVWFIGFAIVYGLISPRRLIREAQEREGQKVQREEEARRDRERLERITKEEREWLERQNGSKPG